MRKRKPKPFTATKAVKAAARQQIGTPPPTRRLPDDKKEFPKNHKPTLRKLLEEAE